MLAKVKTSTILGINGYKIDVEADISGGLPSFDIVGLPDAAVKEAKERVRSAIKNSGFEFPARKIVVNLAPADLKKEGSSFDLPIAIAILQGTEQIKVPDLEEYLFLGELSLSGALRPVNGVLPHVSGAAAQNSQIKKVAVPKSNAYEAAMAGAAQVFGFDSLNQVLGHLVGLSPAEPVTVDVEALFAQKLQNVLDFEQVRGQESAKRAIEVAAAGGHNLLMIGSPGSGKTMLAQRIPTILPPLTIEEALAVTKIYSVAGALPKDTALCTTRPFRSPHHSISTVSLVGGGSNPKPGELSLAHNGVLFLDEFPEFKKDALESMRQPLEDGQVTISRVNATHTYPCKAMLVAAMNPCRCGWYGDKSGKCTCSEMSVHRYLSKISGPLLDRMDVQIEASSVDYADLQGVKGRSSAQMRENVMRARAIQQQRGMVNAQLTSAGLEEYCALNSACQSLVENAFETLGLSARGYTRILKVARTIADLDGSAYIDVMHLAEAISYRGLEGKFWK